MERHFPFLKSASIKYAHDFWVKHGKHSSSICILPKYRIYLGICKCLIDFKATCLINDNTFRRWRVCRSVSGSGKMLSYISSDLPFEFKCHQGLVWLPTSTIDKISTRWVLASTCYRTLPHNCRPRATIST